MKQPKSESLSLPAEALTVKKILTKLKILRTTEIGITLKKLQTPVKRIST